MILLAGPVQAISLSLDNFSNSNPLRGSIISSLFGIVINSNEPGVELPNQIDVYDNNKYLCSFALDGSGSDCKEKGISANLISQLNYGYGYGHGYGYGYGYNNGLSNKNLEYEIKLDTSKFSYGTHKISLKLDDYSVEKEILVKANPGSARTATNEEVPEENNPNENVEPETPGQQTQSTNFLTGAVTGIANFAKTPVGTAVFIITGTMVIGGATFLTIQKIKKIKLRKAKKK